MFNDIKESTNKDSSINIIIPIVAAEPKKRQEESEDKRDAKKFLRIDRPGGIERLFLFLQRNDRKKAEKIIKKLTIKVKTNKIAKIYNILAANNVGELFLRLEKNLLSHEIINKFENRTESEIEKEKQELTIEENIYRVLRGLESKIPEIDEFSMRKYEKIFISVTLESHKKKHMREIIFIERNFKENLEKVLDKTKYKIIQIWGKEKSKKFENITSKILINLSQWFINWASNVEVKKSNIILKVNLERFLKEFIKEERERIERNERNEIVKLGNDEVSRLCFFARAYNGKKGKKLKNEFKEILKSQTCEEDVMLAQVFKALLESNFGDNLINLGRGSVSGQDLKKVKNPLDELNAEKESEADLLTKLYENPNYILESNLPLMKKLLKEIEIVPVKLKLKQADEKVKNLSAPVDRSIEKFFQAIEEQKQKMIDPQKMEELELYSLKTLLVFVKYFNKWIKRVDADDLSSALKTAVYTYDLYEELKEEYSLIEEEFETFLYKAENQLITPSSEVVESESSQYIKPDLAMFQQAKIKEELNVTL